MKYEDRAIVWFSCGASSTVALFFALKKYKHVKVLYCDTGGEHPDNLRYLKDVENLTEIKIEIIKNPKYKDHFDVFEKQKFLGYMNSAPCTLQLKKRPRQKWEKENKTLEEYIDFDVLGYTFEEKNRADRFENNNPEMNCDWILIDKQLTKEDCLGIIWQKGLELPVMYKQGYNHNNCIGCVKGGKGYWNKIRKDYPKHFERMAKIEREIEYSIFRNKLGEPLYLDELPEDAGNFQKEPSITCGLGCGMVLNELENE